MAAISIVLEPFHVLAIKLCGPEKETGRKFNRLRMNILSTEILVER
jgi:hypothetical protein